MSSNNDELQRNRPHPESTGSPILIRASAKGSLRQSLPWRLRDRGDVQVLPGAYLPGFGFIQPNCPRKQNSRPATDQILGVGSSEFPGSRLTAISSPGLSLFLPFSSGKGVGHE